MSAARAAILRRIRSAQRNAHLPSAPGPRRPEGMGASAERCLERFGEELTALDVESHLEATPADVRARVSAYAKDRRVLSWDPELLPYAVGSLLMDPLLGSSPRAQQAIV